MNARNLKPGDMYMTQGIETTIMSERQAHDEFFGRDGFSQFWARRADTGAEGWVIFGPSAEVYLIVPERAS